ncbi:MAG TPA: hypothetical protein PLZ53_11240 [Candidatus Hydrogenedentes bacterium]|nr:hypothetical protein [Candidatus Hydrogenedentota bacterium]HOH43684.1 hypothetical protein [Candidatus Hydrogenedentota bacterium]HQB04221.1 hypothetical protein [Candidatus Hydrogenedentota bacterium]
MAESYNIQQISRLAANFVVKQRGNWTHEQWVHFCSSIMDLQIPLNENDSRHLGLLLESLKALYLSVPKKIKTAKKKTAAKAKAKPKTPPKASA